MSTYSKWQQFSLLSSSRLLTSVAPMLGIPLLVKSSGSQAWVAVAVGQAVGAALVVLVELNWSVMGAGLMGNVDSQSERIAMLRQAFQERVFALLLAAPVAVMVTVLVVQTSQPLAVVSAISGLTLGLSPFWYWAGIGDYRSMLVLEGLTKLALGAATIGMLHLTEWGYVYPVGILLGNVLVCIMPLLGRGPFDGFSVKNLWKCWHRKLTFSVSRLTQSLYVVLPIPILSLMSLPDLGVYTAIDRVFRFFLTMSLPIAQFAQSNVANAPFHEKLRRATKWREFSLVVGFLSCVGMGLLIISPVPRLLFGSGLAPSTTIAIPFVLLSGIISINRIVGQSSMTIFASENVIARNIRWASVAFFIAFLVIVPTLKSAGAAWAMFAAESVALALSLKWIIGARDTLRNKVEQNV